MERTIFQISLHEEVRRNISSAEAMTALKREIL